MTPTATRDTDRLLRAVASRTLERDSTWSCADAIQTARVALLTAAGGHDPARGARFETYCYRVALHACLRARKRYRVEFCPVEPEDDPFARWLLRMTVREAVGRLDDRLRLLIHLRFWAELSQREVAKQLGISASYAHVLEKRALRRLGEMLCN